MVAFVGDQRRAATTSDQNGAFELSLPLGHYTIEATNPGGYASQTTEEVEVSTLPVRITLTVDSGIR